MAETIIRKTFKYRIYPSKAQVTKLELTLSLCRELYNAAVQERRDAWQMNRTNISFASQCSQLPDIKQIRSDLTFVYAQVLQNVLHRVDKVHKTFFSRRQRGDMAGRPRFKSANRFNSFTYPQQGFGISCNGKLRLTRIGDIKIKLHRPIVGKPKTLTIKRDGLRWFAMFTVESAPVILPSTNVSVGIDVGLESFATLSDGTQIDNWRYTESLQKKFRVVQRRIARRKKGSKRRHRAIDQLRKLYRKSTSRRNDFQHKLSADLVKQYDLIAIEKLNVRGLSRGTLARQVNDVAWGYFFQKLRYKAESAGRELVEVAPYWTSQDCSSCGTRVKKSLSTRIHHCLTCGLVIHRDHNAAMNILTLGLSVQAQTCGNSQCVA